MLDDYRPPPRRRQEVPPLGRTPSDETPPLGVLLSEALQVPASEIARATSEVDQVADQMALPPPGETLTYADQSELSYLVGRGLAKVPDVAERCHVPAEVLSSAQPKLHQYARGDRISAAGQNLSADGRLLVGAKFSFVYRRAMEVYGRRLKERPGERLTLLGRFARVDRIRFRLLRKAQLSRAATEAEKETLATTLEEKREEAAFLEALELWDKGQQPEAELLTRAHRHAARLQERYGLSLSLPEEEAPEEERRAKER